MPSLKRSCKLCDKEFTSRKPGPKQIFCSNECRGIFHNNKRKKITRDCTQCGVRFVNKSRNGASKTCEECAPLVKRMRKYNLTVPEYKEMLKKSNNKCDICKEETKLNIDHCHQSGKVRGLLCINCNMGLGSFNDDPNLLKKVVKYLKEVL